MASQGPSSPAYGGQFATGDVAWSNETNLTTENATAASADINMGLVSHQLYGSDFSFSIPSGATIDGIEVGIKRKCLFGAAFDSVVKLLKAGAVVGDNKNAAGYWPASYTYRTYGGAADLWGTTWTDSQINASNFGIAIAATSADFDTASIDHVRITVYYTVSGTYTLSASSGTYTLTGQAASLLRQRKVTATAGSYALTGQSATLTAGKILSATGGSYTLTGTSAGLIVGRKVAAASGSYTLTGQDASLYRLSPLAASAGSYTLTPTSATLKITRKLTASSGSYTLTGTTSRYLRRVPVMGDVIDFSYTQGDVVDY